MTAEHEMELRKATADDIPALCAIRQAQLVDEGIEPTCNIASELERWFASSFANGSLAQWVAKENDEVVATAGIVFYDFPPTWTNPTGRKDYVTNMYTAPHLRGQGIATRMLELLVDEARGRGVTKLWLGASRLGRPVYERFGFRPTNEWMELDL